MDRWKQLPTLTNAPTYQLSISLTIYPNYLSSKESISKHLTNSSPYFLMKKCYESNCYSVPLKQKMYQFSQKRRLQFSIFLFLASEDELKRGQAFHLENASSMMLGRQSVACLCLLPDRRLTSFWTSLRTGSMFLQSTAFSLWLSIQFLNHLRLTSPSISHISLITCLKCTLKVQQFNGMVQFSQISMAPVTKNSCPNLKWITPSESKYQKICQIYWSTRDSCTDETECFLLRYISLQIRLINSNDLVILNIEWDTLVVLRWAQIPWARMSYVLGKVLICFAVKMSNTFLLASHCTYISFISSWLISSLRLMATILQCKMKVLQQRK